MYALYVKADHRYLGDISDDELKAGIDRVMRVACQVVTSA